MTRDLDIRYTGLSWQHLH